MKVLSLGAGVQSSTLALMYTLGDMPEPPACAIFADTQAEPKAVYDWLAWLETKLSFPVYRVTNGSLKDSMLGTGRFVAVPAFTINPDGSHGMGRRQCTSEFKLLPLRRKIQELHGFERGRRLPEGIDPSRMVIGISVDEVYRVKPSQVSYIVNEYPLVDARISRDDCIAWMLKHQFPRPPKSSCSFCPYHDNNLWRHIKDTDTAAWAEAVEVDAGIRRARGFSSEQYLHADRVPLIEVDLTKPSERGQADMFNNECEGMCGV